MTQKRKGKPSSKQARRGLHWLWPLGVACLLFVVGGSLFYLFARNKGAPTATPVAAPVAPIVPLATPHAIAQTPGASDYCRKTPAFSRTLGFSNSAQLSTSSPEVKGMVMIEPSTDANGPPKQTYQHPTWNKAGWLGHMAFDAKGNVYVFPAPRVSLVDNPPELQNMIYRVDSVSAEMTRFITLTASAPPSSANPYGVLGIAYDCDTNSLYAASIAGSTPDHEVGKIVRIDLATKKVASEYTGLDPFGVNIYTLPDGKRLYFGDTRSPQVFSVKLDNAGNFVGEPKPELTLADADFRAWRITFATNGDMKIRGREFDFNLIAIGQAKEVQYTFHYNPSTQGWEQMQ